MVWVARCAASLVGACSRTLTSRVSSRFLATITSPLMTKLHRSTTVNGLSWLGGTACGPPPGGSPEGPRAEKNRSDNIFQKWRPARTMRVGCATRCPRRSDGSKRPRRRRPPSRRGGEAGRRAEALLSRPPICAQHNL